eukprot:CAMPEP_0172806380 /NCGR_PEP_ID=MMETSP1075-20121228/6324_1 /TAXON_ID=2916 /ORGANISM="Ceratium fusus, Strain PA161109" /LENGTH=64 /DNA_ID=CAMNT_0013645171 /DNA_START=532 /DNA_END=723 /DNA_ORIENTATION=+
MALDAASPVVAAAMLDISASVLAGLRMNPQENRGRQPADNKCPKMLVGRNESAAEITAGAAGAS